MPQKGFFASLFDISFNSLITTRIIKVLYVIILIVIGLVSLIAIIGGLSQGGGNAVITIILVPIGALLYTIFARVYLEVLIVLFKIGENTGELVRLQGGSTAGGLGAGTATAGLGAGAGGGVASGGTASAPASGGAAGGGQAAGWYPDPQGQKRLRYWDGSAWTEHTSD